jgi:hypothetical protein
MSARSRHRYDGRPLKTQSACSSYVAGDYASRSQKHLIGAQEFYGHYGHLRRSNRCVISP